RDAAAAIRIRAAAPFLSWSCTANERMLAPGTARKERAPTRDQSCRTGDRDLCPQGRGTSMNVHADTSKRPARVGALEVKTINLALQGGGAHGAFTWGVLDRLLEDEKVGFEGITATSAGTANAAVFAYGLTIGGRDGARQMLKDFWRRVSHAALLSP